jgi:hypothetical protein
LYLAFLVLLGFAWLCVVLPFDFRFDFANFGTVRGVHMHGTMNTKTRGRSLRARLAFGIAVGVFGVLGAAPAFAQETLSSIQRELERVERETARENELHKQERARAAEFEKQKAARLQALQDQIAAADARIDSLKGRSETERRRRASQRAVAAGYQRRQQSFRADLDREMKAMIVKLESDFPYQKERRLSEWRDLAAANRDATLPVEEVLVRVFALSQASLDFAYDSETYPGTHVDASGGRHEGYYVRLGAVTLLFSASDDKLQAYLAREPKGYAWREDGLTRETRAAIREAVSVARGKEAPRLVPLPVEVSAAGGTK